ncbi:MAG: MoaD/ThiS family protein [Terriglobia bacterium]
MAVKVMIPTPLRQYTERLDTIELDAGTVAEALTGLTSKYNGLRKHLYNDDGKLRSFVNIYLNDEDIRYLQKDKTPLNPNDVISIVPSIAGGAALQCICS